MAMRNALKVRYASLIVVGMLLSSCGTGSITGEVGDGTGGGGRYVIPGGDIAGDWDIQVVDSRFYERVLRDSALGLGEAYMDGWWEVESVDQLVDRTNGRQTTHRVAPLHQNLGNSDRTMLKMAMPCKVRESLVEHANHHVNGLGHRSSPFLIPGGYSDTSAAWW